MQVCTTLRVGLRPWAGRRAQLTARSSGENSWTETWKKASSFAQKLRNDLPVIGLISKLTTPTGVTEEAGLSYQEFARTIYDGIDDRMNDTCYTIQEKFGAPGQLRFILCVLWMARHSFGSIPPKAIVKSAVRLRGSRDLEYEIGQFEMLREEEKQKYGYGEAVDYAPQNMIPTAVDALVRLVVGVPETTALEDDTKEALTALLLQVFPSAPLVEIEDAFEQREARAYLYR